MRRNLPQARYFGTVLGERTLVPADHAPVGEIRFDDWLGQSTTGKVATA